MAVAAGVSLEGSVEWGRPVPQGGPGIYVVSLSPDTTAGVPVLPEAPISVASVQKLLEARPELLLQGVRPSPEALAERVAGFWLPDEVILYIGLAGTSVANRIRQYYKTPLGARKPHAGGWFLKLLSNLESLHVHYAPSDDPRAAEDAMLQSFVDSVSDRTREHLFDGAHPFPFANLEWPPGNRKLHGITGAKRDSPRVGVSPLARDSPKAVARGLQLREPPERMRSTRGHVMDVDAINSHIQQQLRVRGQKSTTAVEAARWLDEAGLLKDSSSRPGKPLRDLLRANRVTGQRQEMNSRWFIDRIA